VSDAPLSALENVSAAAEACRDRLMGENGLSAGKLAELDEAVEKLRARQEAVRARTAKAYRQSLRILRGNPSAAARQYPEAMENLRRLEGTDED